MLRPADFVVRLRKIREQLRQQRVDAPLDATIGVQQFVLAREVELRIFLEELEERVEIALEADLVLHREHFAADARDFRQAETVYFVGRHVHGGGAADAPAIPGLAVGQVRPANRGARRR